MAKPERVVLVDGSWLVFRAFFAIPPNLTTKHGLHTNAVFGFATMFRKLFAGRMPERGAVVFDAKGPTHREEKFPAYKAHRPPVPPELIEQLPHVDRVVAANRFPLLRKEGYEADDVIGTLARRAEAAGMDVVIVAGDKDFAQLIGEHVKMLDTLRDVTFDAELVRKKWGVPPSSIIDLLALMGDSTDNIPGVPGIGQKTAALLLEKYGSLDGLLAHVDDLKGKQRDAIEGARGVLPLYRTLATIDVDTPLELTLDDLVLTPPDPSELNVLYKELEFYSLLAEEEGAARGDVTEELVVHVATSEADARDAVVALPAGPVTIVPLFDPANRVALSKLVGVALVVEPGRALYLPQGYATALSPFLAQPARETIAHDAKALWMILNRAGLMSPDVPGTGTSTTRGGFRANVFDTMLASFLVEPTKCVPHRLEQVSKEYLQRMIRPLKSITGSGQKERLLADVPVEEAAAYAAHLADTIARLAPVLREKLAATGLVQHYRDVELPLAFVLGAMELAGIYVDRDDLARMGAEFETRKLEIEKRIYLLAGHEFNIGSTKQLADVLFEELELPVIKKTKTGYSTDAEVLERLAPRHEIAREVLAQRELAKLINTYTDVLRDAISPEDGRVHATFQQTVGVSGRLISTDPDLQRTPVRTPEGKRIRGAFVAPPGTKIISADWSQIELRVLAHFSEDPRLVEAFRENLDLHRRTASVLFGVAEADVTPEQRGVGKTVNFATIYGQGATALGQILGVPRPEAQRYIESYFAHYAGVRAWLDRTIADALQTGWVTTILGRRRYIAELASRTDSERAAGERIAANTPIQGSAADLCKLAMLGISRALRTSAPRTRMLLQVHDELVFESPAEEAPGAMEVIRAQMEQPYPLKVPLVVTVGVGGSWGEAH